MVLDATRYWEDKAQKKRQQGDPGFSPKNSILFFLSGAGCFVLAYLLQFVIDLDNRTGLFPPGMPIFLLIVFGLVLLFAPITNAIRYWRKITGKPSISILSDDTDHPVFAIVIFVVVMAATAAVFGLITGKL